MGLAGSELEVVLTSVSGSAGLFSLSSGSRAIVWPKVKAQLGNRVAGKARATVCTVGT